MANGKTEGNLEIANPGKVTFLEGRGELPMMEVSTAWSTAEIYLQGAHVTHFRKKNEPPLLFLSQCSRFAAGQPGRSDELFQLVIPFPPTPSPAGTSQEKKEHE